jgi:hypothetical protein
MTIIAATDTIRYSSDAASQTSSTTYVKLKELTMTDSYTGSWRIVFDLAGYFDGDFYFSGWGRVYKNGVPYGTERIEAADYYVTKSEDFTGISIANGDLIQLYAHSETIFTNVFIQNFRIEFDPAWSSFIVVD